MKIGRKKISKLPDGDLVSLWRQTGRSEYAGALMLRYLPFVYGVLLDATGDVSAAREGMQKFSGRFSELLEGYDGTGDFAAWLYGNALADCRSGCYEKGLTVAQKDYVRRLSGTDEDALAVFGEAAPGLAKPQRECIRRFFFEGATFETIAEETGYLTDGIRAHIEAGVAKIVPDGSTGQSGSDNIARFREAFGAYIKGERDDADAHAVEMESMLNPFLSAAVGGCTRVPGDHARAIAELDREVEAACFQPRRSRWWLWVLVVFMVIAVVVVGMYLYNKPATKGHMPDKMPPMAAHTVVPENDGMSEAQPAAVESPAIEEHHDAVDAATDPQQEDGAVQLVSVSKTENATDGASQYVSMPKIGIRGYNEYLKNAAIDLAEDVEGDVTITFHVNRYGRPSTIRIIEYLTPEAHREAIRLLDIGPEWSPTEELVTVVMRFGKQQ